MVQEIVNNICTFRIDLPDNPLRWLNCYVIKGVDGGRNLLLDSGFNRSECLDDLLSGIKELGLGPETTDVFFTHSHADHTGNAAALQRLGYKLMMGRIDYQHLSTSPWLSEMRRLGKEGIEEKIIERLRGDPEREMMVSAPFTAELLDDGDRLCYGGYEWECIVTPGHTPGHICLYSKESKIMFTGDQVLFDITPNITTYSHKLDALGDYMASLQKINGYEVELALPAHRTTGSIDFHERVRQLYKHHETRLDEAEQIVYENPGLSAFEVAGQMSWSIRAADWEHFPSQQKWFASGEALAHLVHLEHMGRIESYITGGGQMLYRAKK